MLLQASVAVRRWPDRAARRVAILPQFRADNLPTVVFAVAATHDPAGRLWYLVDVPAPGNATHGWVDARATHLHAVRARIVVDRGARTLTLYLRDRLRLRTKVAVGRPGMPTPTGSFYVRAGYHATEPALGAYAFETSAFSKLSEWPGGGIIGIHGTPEPRLLGTAASHGCVRVSNHAARALARLVPVGAAVSIID
jgi:lipoprotein-anchoring transpeptidase ErfK/SrfK